MQTFYSSSILRTRGIFLKRIAPKVSHVYQRPYIPVAPKTKYGGHYTVTMIAGDGHGPQMMEHIKNIFRTARVPVNFDEVSLDSTCRGSDSMNAAIASVRRNGIAIKGSIFTKADNWIYKSLNVTLRSELSLFANVLHCKNLPGIRARHDSVDIVLIRQNTEGEYSCLEHNIAPGAVESLKIVTMARSEEIARFAFEHCTLRKRKKITCIHKANVMPLTDGLFLNTCADVASGYPEIEFESLFTDTCCSKLVRRPQEFDVLLLPNLYGNVLSSIACGLIGGAGIVPGANYGNDCVVFEVGSRSTMTSMNPLAMLNASIDLLRYLELDSYANVIEKSVNKTLCEDKIVPEDLGGSANALAVTDSVMNNINLF